MPACEKAIGAKGSLLLPEGSAAVPTQYGGAELCDWQQEQLDPTLDGAFKQTDAVYLLLANGLGLAPAVSDRAAVGRPRQLPAARAVRACI